MYRLRPEDNLLEPGHGFHHVSPGIKPRLSRLTAGALTYWVILHTPTYFLLKKVKSRGLKKYWTNPDWFSIDWLMWEVKEEPEVPLYHSSDLLWIKATPLGISLSQWDASQKLPFPGGTNTQEFSLRIWQGLMECRPGVPGVSHSPPVNCSSAVVSVDRGWETGRSCFLLLMCSPIWEKSDTQIANN